MKSLCILEARYYHNEHKVMDGHAKMVYKFCELFKKDYKITLITTFKPLYKELKNIKDVESVIVDLKDVEEFKEIILEHDIFLLTKPDYMFYHPNTYMWIHADYASIEQNQEPLKRWSEKYFTHPYVKKIIFVSPVIENSFVSKGFVPKEKAITIPNWIEDIAKSPKTYEDLKDFKVAWLSRFIPEKGWMDLVEAIKYTDIKADFLGTGDDLEKGIKLKEEEHLENLNFLGFVNNPVEYLKNSAHIYVFTSKANYEAMPTSLLEAISVGIPCISSDIPQARYVLGEKGLYYKSVEELKELIFKLKSDKTLYNEKASYSLERAKLFHKNNIKKMWKDLFNNKDLDKYIKIYGNFNYNPQIEIKERRIEVFYHKKPDVITNLCDKYGTDKGSMTDENHPYTWPAHTYSEIYYLLFDSIRYKVKKLLECGIGTNNPNIPSSMGEKGKPGASLRMWRDFFINAIIYGCDIDKDILFEEERIKTFYCDQIDKNSILNMIKNIDNPNFDIIIDDGLHEYIAGITFFEVMINYLNKDGIYIIEDINGEDMKKYINYFKDKDFLYYALKLYREPSPLGDNQILIIKKL